MAIKKKNKDVESNRPSFQFWNVPTPRGVHYVIFEFAGRRPTFHCLRDATSHDHAIWIAWNKHRKKSKAEPTWVRVEGHCCSLGCLCGGLNEGLGLEFPRFKYRVEAVGGKLGGVKAGGRKKSKP